MSLPIVLHSGMTNAPALTYANGSLNSLLLACLVNGFNSTAVTSASASGGVVTFNFAAAPGFSELDTVEVAGATNTTVNGKRRVQSIAGTQVLIAIPGVPDGAVAGAITMKFASLGWTNPYSSGTTTRVYRQGQGGETYVRNLRVYDGTVTTENMWYVRGYGAMTAHSTGTEPFPTTGQIAGQGAGMYSIIPSGSTAASDRRPWLIVGTHRAFYMCQGYGFDNGGVSSVGLQHPSTILFSGQSMAVFFGDLAGRVKPNDAYATVCPGGISYGIPVAQHTSYLQRNASAVSGAVVATGVSPTGGATSVASSCSYPSPTNGGLTLRGPVAIYDGDAPWGVRGFLPGQLCPFELIGSAGNAAFKVGATIQNVPGVTGRLLFVSGSAGQSYAECWLTLDEDWGNL